MAGEKLKIQIFADAPVHSRTGGHRNSKAAPCPPMRSITTLHIPQPCHESWDAMSPTATGRHCAACAKTVVDFTLKTDAEILAHLAGAAVGRTCGRFAAGQLERPLQRAAPVAPAARWRAWLAAAVSVWAVREGLGTEAKAQTATEWRARYWGGPVPAAPPTETPEAPATTVPLKARKPVVAAPPPPIAQHFVVGVAISAVSVAACHDAAAVAPLVLRGLITDVATSQGLPGVTVLIKGTTTRISTAFDGSYELPVPAQLANAPALTISVSSVGFMTQERALTNRTAAEKQNVQLKADNRMLGEVVICRLPPRKLPPAPWHPRAFYSWGKYWLTRPFRHN